MAVPDSGTLRTWYAYRLSSKARIVEFVRKHHYCMSFRYAAFLVLKVGEFVKKLHVMRISKILKQALWNSSEKKKSRYPYRYTGIV
jgi:hypothetical protein